MPETISIRAYARLRGVDEKAVRRAIKDGRIQQEPDGKLNPDRCDELWDLSTDTAQQRGAQTLENRQKKAKEKAQKAGKKAGKPHKKTTVLARKVIKNAEKLAEARAGSEDYKSKLLRLKFEQQSGKLVDADVIKKRAFESARTLREALLNLPNQLANDLASETDAVKCANILTIEITRLLEEMAAPRLSAALTGMDAAISSNLQQQVLEDDEEHEGEDELEIDGIPVEPPR